MVIQIALGIMLGFVFLAIVVLCGFVAGIYLTKTRKIETKKNYDFDVKNWFDDYDEED